MSCCCCLGLNLDVLIQWFAWVFYLFFDLLLLNLNSEGVTVGRGLYHLEHSVLNLYNFLRHEYKTATTTILHLASKCPSSSLGRWLNTIAITCSVKRNSTAVADSIAFLLMFVNKTLRISKLLFIHIDAYLVTVGHNQNEILLFLFFSRGLCASSTAVILLKTARFFLFWFDFFTIILVLDVGIYNWEWRVKFYWTLFWISIFVR